MKKPIKNIKLVEMKDVKFEGNDLLIEGKVFIMSPNPENWSICEYSIFVPKNQ